MSNYEFRKLSSKDIFPMVNLIKKFGIDNFKKALQNNDFSSAINKDGEVNGNQLKAIVGINIMIDVVGIIVDNIGKCEEELFTFLASVSNLKVKEIKELPMDVFAEMIIEFIQKEELASFFGVVFKLLK